MTHPTSRWTLVAGFFLLAVPLVMFTGCETVPAPGIVETSPNVYTATVRDKASSQADLKRQAVGAALDFAEGKGKVAIPVSLQQHESGVLTSWMVVEYQFKLVDKSESRAKRTAPDDADKKPDVYAELMKLDDLRKKGILTQAEFDSEKKKLLAQPR
jgi:hypothetical protein